MGVEDIMVEPSVDVHEGILELEKLFIGSKSENFFPVLIINNDTKFRLNFKKLIETQEFSYKKYIGNRVKVFGKSDILRGHSRINVDSMDFLDHNNDSNETSKDGDGIVGGAV
jgi:hypothetical protein